LEGPVSGDREAIEVDEEPRSSDKEKGREEREQKGESRKGAGSNPSRMIQEDQDPDPEGFLAPFAHRRMPATKRKTPDKVMA
jgi:hypothetical protein